MPENICLELIHANEDELAWTNELEWKSLEVVIESKKNCDEEEQDSMIPLRSIVLGGHNAFTDRSDSFSRNCVKALG